MADSKLRGGVDRSKISNGMGVLLDHGIIERTEAQSTYGITGFDPTISLPSQNFIAGVQPLAYASRDEWHDRNGRPLAEWAAIWRLQNTGAIAGYNDMIETSGIPLSEFRKV